MKKLIIASVILISCVFAAPSGLLFTYVKSPVAVTSADTSSKVGYSSAFSLLWLFAFGDAGIQTAMKDAKIAKAQTVDKTTIILPFGLIVVETTEVHGS